MNVGETIEVGSSHGDTLLFRQVFHFRESCFCNVPWLASFLVRKKFLHRQPRDTPQRTVSHRGHFCRWMMCEKHLRGIFLKWNPIANDELQERPSSLEKTPDYHRCREFS